MQIQVIKIVQMMFVITIIFYSKGNVIYTGVGHAGNNSPKGS